MEQSVPLPPLLPPLPQGTSLALAVQRTCCTCNADISRTKRTLDLQGRYYCPDCWSQRVTAGTAVDLVPAGSNGSAPIQQQLRQALARSVPANGSAASPIVLYIAPAPGSAAERGKIAFFSGFYATAGIAVALTTLAIGVAIFFGIVLLWQRHQIASLNSLRQETPIEQDLSDLPVSADGAISALPAVHLEAGVDGESTLRVAALNDTAQPLKKVIVEVVPDRGAAMALLNVGSLKAGQTKTLFLRVPGLREMLQRGQSVHLRTDTVPVEPSTPK